MFFSDLEGVLRGSGCEGVGLGLLVWALSCEALILGLRRQIRPDCITKPKP